jgi:hypothetical protein
MAKFRRMYKKWGICEGAKPGRKQKGRKQKRQDARFGRRMADAREGVSW